MNTLKEHLENWNDFDGAAYSLGLSLGVFQENQSFQELKYVFWTNNPLGNMLHEMLEELVKTEILIKNEDDQYKWNNDQKEY